jgi:hypothetical protein
MTKQYFDEQGNLIIRPYRLTDLAAIYAISRHTIRRWINEKAAAYGTKTKKYFSVEQVQGIVNALGIPQKITPLIVLQQFKKAS